MDEQKPEFFGWFPCREPDMKMKNERVSLCLWCSLLSCRGPPCVWYLTVSSWVVPSSAQHTMCSRVWGSTRSRSFISLMFILNSSFQISFKLPFSSLIHSERVRRWSCITDKDTAGIFWKFQCWLVARCGQSPALLSPLLVCCYGDRHWVTYTRLHTHTSSGQPECGLLFLLLLIMKLYTNCHCLDKVFISSVSQYSRNVVSVMFVHCCH